MEPRVSDVMVKPVCSVPVDASISVAAALMRDHGVGFLPVTQEERVVGVLTDRDLTIRAVANRLDPKETQVRTVYTDRVVWCRPSDTLSYAEVLMRQNLIRRILVLDAAERVVGVVALDDIAQLPTGHASAGELLGALGHPEAEA